jgi:hygromycin-B 7''-O-kinase
MIASLPAVTDDETFPAFRADPAQWLPVARDIVRGHGLACASPHVFATGTNLVLALDEKLILKLFPPFLRGQFVSERGTLTQLHGRLRVAIPEIVAEGERDGWPYLVMTRLSGVLGADAWPTLPEADKERILAEIGGIIAEVQRVPAGSLAQIGPGWDAFVRGQIEGCRARHARLGLPQKFLDGLDELLSDAAMLTALDGPPVILTGEYIPENFLLNRDGADWHVAGLFDFGDVMTGRGEYDLLGPSAFMTEGRPRRVQCLFEALAARSPILRPS